MIREILLSCSLGLGVTAAWAADSSSIGTACDANFDAMMSSDSVNPGSFVAWASVPGVDAHKTIAQFKAIAPQNGFDVGADSYYGTQGMLLLAKKSAFDPKKVGIGLKPTSDLTGFPLEVLVDQTLGTISLETAHRTQEDISFKRVYFQNTLCGLLTEAAGEKYKKHFDPSVQPSLGHPRNPFAGVSLKTPQQQQKEQLQLNISQLKGLLQRALPSGKSVVVMATVNPVFGISQSEMQFSKRGQFLSNLSAKTMWQGPGGSPLTLVRAGYEDDARSVGLHGNIWASGHGPRIYLLYIVDPGTYTLVGNSVDGFKAKVPGIGAGPATAKSSLGEVVLANKQFTENTIGTAHVDPTYKARNVETCTLEIAGGPCVQSYGTTVYDQTSAGGSYQTAMGYPTFGLNASTTLSKGFASFNVAAGEAVLVDGMFGGYPNATINEASCQPTAEGAKDIDNPYNIMQCALKQYTLLRVPANKEELLRTSQEYAAGLPELMTILSSVKERPLTITATPGEVMPGVGQMYSLHAGK